MSCCPSLPIPLEPLDHHQNVASLSLSYSYYFLGCSSELAELVSLPHSSGKSTRYSNRLHVFFVAICRCYEDVYVNSFFPLTAKVYSGIICLKNPFLWPTIEMALTLVLIDTLFLWIFFNQLFLYPFHLFLYFPCNCMSRSGSSTLCGVRLGALQSL